MKKYYLAVPALIFIFTSCVNHIDPLPDTCTGSFEIAVQINANPLCDVANGSITFSSTSEETVMYSLDGGEFQSSGTFDGLTAKQYSVAVSTESGCTLSKETILNSDSPLEISGTSSTDSGCKTSDGSITVTAAGGTGIEYKIDNGSFQSSSLFENLSAGIHTITITDDAGCIANSEQIVSSGVSFVSDIRPIIMVNCAISGCHDGNTSGLPNWNNLLEIQGKATTIKSFTASGFMPEASSGLTLTSMEKSLIACWVDDGAKDN